MITLRNISCTHMTQMFKTLNSRTIFLYFTCYCNKIIAMPIYAQKRICNVTFVQQMTVYTSYLTLEYKCTNIRFYRPTNVIYTLFSYYLFFPK